ncbi:MAG: fimbria/pilus outer membrane usher protein [Roseiarcus sp.]
MIGRGAFIILCFAGMLAMAPCAGYADTSPGQKNLQLEVIINGAPANMIGSFVLFDGKRLGATRNELEDVGLDIGQRRFPQDIVILDDIPGLKYVYDEPGQAIRITVDNARRRGQTFDLSGGGPKLRAQTGWGALLNYDLLSTTDNVLYMHDLLKPGASLTVDGRAFSPYGTFEQSGIVNSDANQASDAIRLNSTFEYSDQDNLVTYRAGDVINGGLTWTRPLRIGGLQAQSDFALRPDLITMPLPTLGGIAAVPSTVDVYVNNIKTFSQDIAPGPFSINNIPVITGAGNAQLVVTDSSGAVTKTTAPFFASASLLSPGLSSWSLEAGLPRLSYGTVSDAYVESPVGSATLRRGIFDWMTAESHVEGGAGVANGGVGAVVKTGAIGVASAALAVSDYSGSKGLQGSASYQAQLFGLMMNASSQRTFGNYNDLVSATARLQPLPAGVLAAAMFADALPPKALDTVTISAPLPFDPKSSFSANFIHSRAASGELSEIVSASYSRSLPFNASVFATVFHDCGTNRNAGVFVGLNFPLGASASVSSSYSYGSGGGVAQLNAVKPLGLDPGSYGWSVEDAEGGAPYHAAAVSYRSSYGTVQAGATANNATSSGSLELRGSIATMGGDVFLSNWIDDGFGVVSTGAPGVGVLYENQPVGVTDSKGMLLVPTLRSYERNNIAIDPTNLPAAAEVEGTSQIVAPANHGGMLVNFRVHDDTNAALVIFSKADGGFVPAGTPGKIEGGDEFVVGYDGETFIRNLRGSNVATVELAAGACRVVFAFTPQPGEQVRIGPLTCQQVDGDALAAAGDPIGLRK